MFTSGLERWPRGQVSTLHPKSERPECDLVCYGVQRSGSSWIYHVAREIAGENIIKTHDFIHTANNAPVVASYRDLRDCVVSHWRFRYAEECASCGQMPEDRMVYLACLYSAVGWQFDRYLQFKSPVVLRFEEFIASPMLIVKAIEQATGLSATDPEGILERCSLERARKVCAGEEPLPEGWVLIPDHVHESQPGSWRNWIPEHQHEFFTDLFRPWLTRHGYLPSD